MMLLTYDYKNDCVESTSGLLIAKPKKIILPSGIVTIKYTNDNEQTLIYDNDAVREISSFHKL